MHVKFDDKEPRNETPEQDESFADIQFTEDTPEPDQTDESKDSPEEQIAWVFRRASEGRYVSGLDNNKTSPWNETVNKTMFNSTKKGKYRDLSMEHKMLLKIQNENLLPKGGGWITEFSYISS